MASVFKCNYDSTIGEFYSGKQKIYTNTITSNNINSKIFTIISGISILFTIVFFVISFVIYKNNQSTNNNNNSDSAFSTGPKILLVLGIISFIVVIITIFFIYKYKIQETPKPLIDDEQRPCYSEKQGKKLDPIPSLNTAAAPPPPPVLVPTNSSTESNSVTMNLIKGITGDMTTLNKNTSTLENSTSKPPSDNLNTIINNSINNNASSLTNNNQSMSANVDSDDSDDENDKMFTQNQSASNTDNLNSNNIINNNVNLE